MFATRGLNPEIAPLILYCTDIDRGSPRQNFLSFLVQFSTKINFYVMFNNFEDLINEKAREIVKI